MMNEVYREWAIEHEYRIPSQMNYLAAKCPHVTWDEAQKLYQLAVEQTKIVLNVEHIIDAPFGRGLVTVRNIFSESMRGLERFRIEEEKTRNKEWDWNDID